MVEMKSHEETEHLCDDGKRKADFFTLNAVFNRGAKSNPWTSQRGLHENSDRK